jgi:hypothetical protein
MVSVRSPFIQEAIVIYVELGLTAISTGILLRTESVFCLLAEDVFSVCVIFVLHYADMAAKRICVAYLRARPMFHCKV